VDKIRVLVANRPRLMRDLVTATVADQPDVEVVGEVGHDGEILELIELKRPDALIIALDGPGTQSGLCDRLLERHPRLRILALDPHTNTSLFYWGRQDIYAKAIETSEEGVLSALRGRPYGAAGRTR
jgi:DNA-binding NarL/FixJ family response regulator